jgi:hypothetical protein
MESLKIKTKVDTNTKEIIVHVYKKGEKVPFKGTNFPQNTKYCDIITWANTNPSQTKTLEQL